MTPAQKNALISHRKRQAEQGIVRLEINVPKKDKDLLRSVASLLRNGGVRAGNIRQLLESAVAGEELVNFKKYLEMAPLEGVDIERSTDPGLRNIEF